MCNIKVLLVVRRKKMDITPKHYSYKFKFNIDKLPAEQKDRLSRRLIFCGIVFGLVI